MEYDNLTYTIHEKSKIPFSYMLYAYSVKKPIGKLNLKKAKDSQKIKIEKRQRLPGSLMKGCLTQWRRRGKKGKEGRKDSCILIHSSLQV